MSLILSKYAKGLIALPYPSAADDATGIRFSHTLSTAPALGDILELGVIPAGCRVIDLIFDGDDLDADAAPVIVADVGIMSGTFGSEDDTRTCGAEFFSGSTLLQSGGVERPTLKSAYRTTKASTDRGIGVKFTTAPATFAAGTIGLTVIVATE